MKHIDRMIQQDPELRHVDYQRLVQRLKEDPQAHWAELVRVSSPIVFTAAGRLASHLPEGEALADRATLQVFERLAEDDYAIIRGYVGFGRFPSLLVRLTEETPALEALVDGPRPDSEDPDQPTPDLSPRLADLIVEEGEALPSALFKVMRRLHRQDRLLLAMRYEQGLSLRELDQIFRLGSPERVGALLVRLLHSLQPLAAVMEAWQVEAEQEEALAQGILRKIFAEHSLGTEEEQKAQPALQAR